MPFSTYRLSPLLRVLCMAILANGVLLALKLYAMASGTWAIEPMSVLTLGLTIYVMIALLRLNRLATKRISAIAETAKEIIHTGDLSRRVPLHGEQGGMTSMTAVLNQMLDEIEALMHSARTASDSIAHDLRHPLTRLRHHLEELRESMEGIGSPACQQQLAALVAECDALLSTFQAILRISNIESARRHGGFREVNMSALLQDIIELYEPITAEKHIEVQFDATPASAIGDKDLLFQAFANLVDNAIKYTPEQGVIHIGIAPHGQGCEVTISDSGPGIPDSHKPNVFQRFYRIDPSRSEPGSGLGLSLVNAIVKLHQGLIRLEDVKPTGLQVTVTL